ncbi:hypothetical protein [Streptomyces sp. FH025]|uniref:hypothetical protein n=1 Tax=Streptomyces sp. FH025 TaxID=2815937 RepID=UPI001A9D2734|nr:hypothetical protein [Streptomyces sp. FH025]MBO1418049.1 hypothetical protein [Streptomyces sp. FH025]
MEQDRVELAYALTGEDFQEAFAAQARHTLAGRLARIAMWVPAAMAVLGGAAKAADGEAGAGDAVLLAALVALALLAPRLQLRSAQGRAARRGGDYRAVVDAAGVSVTDARGVRALTWSSLPRFLETEHLFVALNRSGTCVMLLPKRATPAPGALRALLARHATPVAGAAAKGQAAPVVGETTVEEAPAAHPK